MKNEERYIKEIPHFLLDYYKWYFEEIEKKVKLEEDDQKDVATENTIFEMCNVCQVFICRDGSFAWVFACSWNDDGFAVLLSESEPRVITRDQLCNLHKLNDNAFGTLIHDNKKYWATWDQLLFYNELASVFVEVEGDETEGVNASQQKIFTQYLLHKSEYLKKLSDFLLPIYLGDKEEAEKMIQTKQPVVVKTVTPKRLIIDKNGNFGWICHTNWDNCYIGVLLSEKQIYVMRDYQLRELSESKILKDDVCGNLFIDDMFGCKTEIVRLFNEISTDSTT